MIASWKGIHCFLFLFFRKSAAINVWWLRMTSNLMFYFYILSLYINYFLSLIRYHTRPSAQKMWRNFRINIISLLLSSVQIPFIQWASRLPSSQIYSLGLSILRVHCNVNNITSSHPCPLSTDWLWVKRGNHTSKHRKQAQIKRVQATCTWSEQWSYAANRGLGREVT